MDSYKTKKVILTGASGMIGGIILKLALEHADVHEVVSLARRPSGINHPKLNEVILEDFTQLDSDATFWKNVYVGYYCIGVYTGSVPREKFREITVDAPVAFGKILIEQNPNVRFVLLSGQGADRSEKSRMMFAQDKGAVENALSNTFKNRFHTFRPGYIYPVEKRKEPNLSYRLMRRLYPVLKRIGMNSSVTSEHLAKAMFRVGLDGGRQEIYENKDILKHSNHD